MKFIHTGDIHLGAAPDSLTPWADSRKAEIRDTFCRLLEQAAAEETDLLLIAGDLFHRQPLGSQLREVNYWFSKMPDTQIVLIAGNHDCIGEHSPCRSFEWAPNVSFFRKNHLSYIYLKKLNTIVYGMSYDRAQITEPLYDTVRPMKRFADGQPVPEDAIHILLGHGGDSLHIPIQMSALRQAGFDYVALGHIHKPWIDEEAPIAYCGALEPIDQGDEGEHGYIRGVCEDGEVFLDFVPFAFRSYRRLVVDLDADMTVAAIVDQVKSRIRETGPGDLYKLILEGVRDPQLEMEYDRIRRAGRILSIEDQSAPGFDFDLLYQENKDNVIGMFIRQIRESAADERVREKALLYGMKALYQIYRGDRP